MKKILVPTDFSANADKALNYAVSLAGFTNAEVHLLHAAQVTDSSATFPVNPQYAAFAGNNEEAVKKLAAAAENFPGHKIHTHVYAGFVLESILKATTDLGADLVVMGTLGDSGIREKLFGSITASVIGRSAVPVLAIPLMADWNDPKKILFAINEFDKDPAGIEILVQIADALGAEIDLAVFTDTDTADAADYIENAKGITAYERRLNDHFPGKDIKAERLYGSKFQDALDDHIEKNGIDIIAMVTHKRNLLEKLFRRSMTSKISYHTDIPLLAMPA